MEHNVTLPGIPAMASVARHYVRELLADCPRVDDVELVVSELVGNALRHTRSGGDGSFTLRVLLKPGWVRVEVADQGGPGAPQVVRAGEEESGRGLAIVAMLADRIGHDLTVEATTVWAEFGWPT
ncbi:hypothetical protein TH66_23280 [Carbonactinospora thermoautotrophica]|uniref:Putative anti-sigma regulatory factor n=1 Tax=Carbonactinospora thermoautotrophica TaxID=1469144 RepID=A0A132NL08_9ACTN|nr:ATP-binding protein [Carbonactinospora thermoautotrophica]KWW98164.1 hypothetical protein TH66_23280 [Carbonactinospora thermoautotrophica]KWX02806.1 putative anti-sigma regulatory factor [Carbonactinospora thermoautotrophica]KWX10623.1 hypothetical protein TR74_02525 [Carbonactinospora thermoautotrophica]